MVVGISDIKIGQKAKVVGYQKNPTGRSYRQKLLAMGLTKGIDFTVVRVAPMGDPIEIRLRGFALSLRKEEAAALQVELL